MIFLYVTYLKINIKNIFYYNYQMSILKKEDYIHISHNSITDELCDDILTIFENNIIKNDLYIESKNCCYEIIDTDYKKIRIFLKNELIRNLKEYDKNINKVNNKILNYEVFENFKFYIKTDRYLNYENYEIQDKFNWNSNGWKVLNFIWFLNDIEGEFIFWNKYNVNPKKGTLIIFPSSWCFPYKQIIKICSKMNIIYGYLYKKKKE